MKIQLSLLLLIATNFVFATVPNNGAEKQQTLKMLTLNLHGYHPTGELPRWFQSRDGSIKKANPDIFFFKEEELVRGHKLRLDRLARDINTLSPDIVFFQEVGAGAPSLEKNCNTFFRRDLSKDSFELNSAVKLHKNLIAIEGANQYNLMLACRGNIGWITDSKLFSERRVVVFPNNNLKEPPRVVFDFNTNPYPSGMMVEGLGVLVKNSWRILGDYQWRLPINRLGDTFFLQVVVIRQTVALDNMENEEGPWLVLLNIHGVHNLRHFEASVRVREELEKFIRSAPWKGKYLGAVVAGDFNAKLYRPNSLPESEISSMPWEIKFPGEFDFTLRAGEENWRKNLTNGLLKISDNRQETLERINDVVDRFVNYQHNSSSEFLVEALSMANKKNKCVPFNGFDAACNYQYRIDHVFVPESFTINNAYIIYKNNNFGNLNSLTDHPGLFVELDKFQ
jgi:endonuclease/exonuclease/phosphatase family metal-dependent hydrolase